MTAFTILSNSTTAQTLNGSENGFVGAGATLAVPGLAAITATGANTVFVSGEVYGSLNAIAHQGSVLKVNIGAGAMVQTSLGDAINSIFTWRLMVVNEGTVFGDSAGVYAFSDTSRSRINIANNGSITGGQDGIQNYSDAGTGTLFVTNNGTITGVLGDGIFSYASAVTLVNNGIVSGRIYALQSSADVDLVRNNGTMNGTTYTAGGNDRVINRGSIEDVELGAGDDVFDGRKGVVNGTVYGGDGNDTYIVDASDISIREAVRGGIDEVRSTVSYSLGGNLENLVLLGGRDINGRGNGADNSLTGNGGDNVLRGQAGNDEIRAGDGDDRLVGGRGNDRMFGDNGNDRVIGGSGNDRLVGGDGDDRLIGGGGRDIMLGGRGNDVFVFNRVNDSPDGGSADRINDFEIGIDRIDLSGLVAPEIAYVGSSGFTGSGSAEVMVTTSAGNTIVRVDVDGDGTSDMRFNLINVTGVTEGDFIL